MPIGRRSGWKFSFGHRSSAVSSSSDSSSSIVTTSSSSSSSSSNDGVGIAPPAPPASFICPISSSLMYDPVIVVPTGHTFERACIQAYCTAVAAPASPPQQPDSSSSSSTSSNSPSPFFIIPNSALRAAIIDWCDHFSVPHPSPIPLQSALLLAHNFISATTNNPLNSISSALSIPQSQSESPPQQQQQQQQQQLQEGKQREGDNKTLNTITTEKQSTSSSTFSSSSSSSSSSEIAAISFSSSDDANNTPKIIPIAEAARNCSRSMMRMDPLEEEILVKLKSPQISVRESGVISLRQSTRDSPDCRASLCTPRILAALLPLIPPSTRTSPSLRINATAAIVNLSIDPPANKVTIVRSGALPPLVKALTSACRSSSTTTEGEDEEEEARYNAAGALFSLSLEDGNKLAIGVLGAIPPLVHLFCQQSARQAARLEAGMALYHLSLAPNNLSKIAKTPGAVKAILNIAKGRDDNKEEEAEKISILYLRLQRAAMMILASLARRNEGRVALMDADAVKAMVRMMEEETERRSTAAGGNTASSFGKEEEYCLGVLYEMSRGSLRFRALARAAGAERVLISAVTASHQEASRSGEVAKEMARRILKVIRGDQEERRMSAAIMMLRNKTPAEDDDDDEEEIGSVVSDGLVSFRRRCNDDFGAGSSSNSANF